MESRITDDGMYYILLDEIQMMIWSYDIKGKRYINSPYKYYFMDLGLRNARINFRQSERSHLIGEQALLHTVGLPNGVG